MDVYSVAIDGPSGAGKSSVAKAVAKELDFIYVDTGAIYRTVGLATVQNNIAFDDKKSIMHMLEQLDIDLRYNEDGVQHMYMNGNDVNSLIRTPEISNAASLVSAIQEVRDYLMETQRGLARSHSVIMDGRDIGTVVLPDAGLKIYMTASPEARALRRKKELDAKGIIMTFDQVLSDMKQRDEQDSTRTAAPLKAAEDAVYLDTSDMTFEESKNSVEKLIHDRFGI